MKHLIKMFYYQTFISRPENETIVPIGIKYKKISWRSAWRWRIVKNAKIFWSYGKISEFTAGKKL